MSDVYKLPLFFFDKLISLQKNNLTSLAGGGSFEDLSLLKVIDLSSNSLTNVPEEFKSLRNLQVITILVLIFDVVNNNTSRIIGVAILNLFSGALFE